VFDIANVPADVTGDPVTVRPVGTDKATEVTVPFPDKAAMLLSVVFTVLPPCTIGTTSVPANADAFDSADIFTSAMSTP
jgi:hypothetical protein